MPQFDLRMRAGQGDRARDRPTVVVLLDESPGPRLGVGESGRERQPRGASGRQANRLAEADDRIEHGAGRVRQRAAAAERGGVGERPPASDEPRPVGFVLGGAADAAAAAQYVDQVDAVGTGPRTARAEQGVPFGYGRRLDEEVAERRVGQVGARRGEDDFGVAGQVEAACPMAVVGDRHAPQLGIVFGRDDDLGPRFQARVDTAPDGAVERERGLVLVRLAPRGLVRRRPDVTGIEIAHEDEAAPGIARDVLAPARQGQLLTLAVAATSVGHHHRVRAVRQQVRARAEGVWRRVEAHRRRDGAPDEGYVRGRLHRRILQRDELRHALLEEELGRLNPGIGVKPLLHRRVVQDVVEREQAHALVVSHPRPQHHAALVLRGLTLGCVVDGFVVAEPAVQALGREAHEVFEHGVRRDRRRQD